MENNWNIEQMERRMPYTVPEDFFENSYKKIMAATINDGKAKKKRNRTRKLVAIMTSVVGVAAVTMAAFFALQHEMPQDNTMHNEANISAHIDNMIDNMSDEELNSWTEYTDPDMYLASY